MTARAVPEDRLTLQQQDQPVLPRDHPWTVADLDELPDDGLRYELCWPTSRPSGARSSPT